jgi:hypothetical protein
MTTLRGKNFRFLSDFNEPLNQSVKEPRFQKQQHDFTPMERKMQQKKIKKIGGRVDKFKKLCSIYVLELK